jgi:hypothetical protein
MKEAPGSSETSVLTRATRRNNPEDTILHIFALTTTETHVSRINKTLKKLKDVFVYESAVGDRFRFW